MTDAAQSICYQCAARIQSIVSPYLDGAIFPAGFQSQHPEGLGNDHPLLAVVGWRNTLKELQPLERGGTPGGFVGYHAANGTEKNFRRSAVVEGTRLLRVNNVALVKEVVVAELRRARCCMDLVQG